uniref:Acyl carrier protein n=1 Tax=Candidatus Kentrum sp. FW TaxID=2126338 RepID=A0A450TYS4_9GAMM|nr:MAG: acyl carrier protein [Candidatus Kentron sp. FW]
MPKNILQEVIDVVGNNLRSSEIEASTRFVEDLSLPSIEVMDLLSDVEDHFDVSIPLKELPTIEIVEDLANRIEELIIDKEQS